MKVLNELKLGERATVRTVSANADMVRRLRSLGVFTGAEIKLLQIGFFGRTYLIEADGVRLGMGKSLAKKILVESAPTGGEET